MYNIYYSLLYYICTCTLLSTYMVRQETEIVIKEVKLFLSNITHTSTICLHIETESDDDVKHLCYVGVSYYIYRTQSRLKDWLVVRSQAGWSSVLDTEDWNWGAEAMGLGVT